nr:immunoglobulin heavy chain junction region [Mus musculus]
CASFYYSNYSLFAYW